MKGNDVADYLSSITATRNMEAEHGLAKQELKFHLWLLGLGQYML